MPAEKATDRLSDEARAVMTRGFAAGWTAARIVDAVREATKEVVAPRTVARRANEWRASKRTFDAGVERWKQLLEAKRQSPADTSAMIEALAHDYLLQNPNAMDAADPIKLSRAALAAEELALKRRQVEIKERAIGIDERRVKLLEDRESRAIAALSDKGETSTPEERLKRVQEIYGIA